MLKNAVYLDVAPCRSCVNRRFGGTYSLHLHGRKIREKGSRVSRWLLSAYVPVLHLGLRNLDYTTSVVLWQVFKYIRNNRLILLYGRLKFLCL
jgi:hypothetical protein